MKFSTIVRAISPFARSSSGNSNAAKDQLVQSSSSSTHTWELKDVDLKYALKIFYKKYNPEKSFIVSDIIQKYQGEEQLLLRQLQDRYNLSYNDIQSYLDRSKSIADSRPNNFMRRQSRQSITEDNPSDEREATWDLANVDVTSLLIHIYSVHNPLRTPNVDILKQKSDREIIIILRQLCKRHNISIGDMSTLVERFRITDNHAHEPDEANDFQDENSVFEEHYEFSDNNQSGDDLSGAPFINESESGDKFSSAQRRSSLRRITVTRKENNIVSGRRASATIDSQQQTPSIPVKVRDAVSIRHRPISTQGDGKVAMMDEVLKQMNVKQQPGKPQLPPPPPPPHFNSNYSNRPLEIESLQQTCTAQQQKIIEFQELIEQLRSDNRILIEQMDEIRTREMISVSTQAVDLIVHEGIEESQRKLKESIQANNILLQEVERLRRFQNEEMESQNKALEGLKKKTKALQGDRENVLQFVNALCLFCSPAKKLVDAYFSIVLGEAALSGDEPVSAQLDRVITESEFVTVSQLGNSALKDHRAIMKRALELCESSTSTAAAGNIPISSDTSDKDAVLQEQYNLAKKLMEARKNQYRIEERMAETNFLLLQSSLGSAEDTMEVHKQISSRSATPNSINSGGRRKAETRQDQENKIDWIECVDPKSKRKYYYSPSLKKSTWTRPTGIDGGDRNEILAQSLSQGNSSQTLIENGAITKFCRRPLNVRDSSPSPSLQSLRSSSSMASDHSAPSLFSQRSKGFRPSASTSEFTVESDWIAAIDPKSNRKYYFNR
jgi:hypothetical protein